LTQKVRCLVSVPLREIQLRQRIEAVAQVVLILRQVGKLFFQLKEHIDGLAILLQCFPSLSLLEEQDPLIAPPRSQTLAENRLPRPILDDLSGVGDSTGECTVCRLVSAFEPEDVAELPEHPGQITWNWLAIRESGQPAALVAWQGRSLSIYARQ